MTVRRQNAPANGSYAAAMPLELFLDAGVGKFLDMASIQYL